MSYKKQEYSRENIVNVYKIVEKHDTILKTLFKAIEGSKTLKRKKWLKAEKKHVTDGSGGKLYLSGIHCFLNENKAKTYLQKFPTKKPRIIIQCQAIGLRQKPTNKDVYLADMIKIN